MKKGDKGVSKKQPMRPFGGYDQTALPKIDPELTLTGPGTPCGEFMRGFWHPVLLSEQLDDTPTAIRILGEDLVAFRDKSGRVGVLHRHCIHRGASLEFGIIEEDGLRCCYHGFKYDVDGTILNVPGIPDCGAALSKKVFQGAYPAFERDGLVFAYMGPSDEKPAFPEWDTFTGHADSKVLACTNIYPCNWLQAQDNAPDNAHASVLHATSVVEGYEDMGTLVTRYGSGGYEYFPVMKHHVVNDGNGIVNVAVRRTVDHKIWISINHQFLPNGSHHSHFFETGKDRRLFTRSILTRWVVPVDDENCIQFQLRYFGPTIDPYGLGDETRMGYDDMDFLEGQVGGRPYKLSQRAPGDWEVIVSQRSIAIHALEHPMAFDSGVFMNRKLLREAVRGDNPAASPASWNEWAAKGPVNSYCQCSVLDVKRVPTDEEELTRNAEIGDRVLKIMVDGDRYDGEERVQFIKQELTNLEQSYNE